MRCQGWDRQISPLNIASAVAPAGLGQLWSVYWAVSVIWFHSPKNTTPRSLLLPTATSSGSYADRNQVVLPVHSFDLWSVARRRGWVARMGSGSGAWHHAAIRNTVRIKGQPINDKPRLCRTKGSLTERSRPQCVNPHASRSAGSMHYTPPLCLEPLNAYKCEPNWA